MGDKVRITLMRSTIGAVPKNRRTIAALGLKRPGNVVELPNNASTWGAIRKVAPYLKVEEI